MTVKKREHLRSGFTTGTAAAAAAKGALTLLLSGKAPQSVAVTLLTGDALDIAVADCRADGPVSAVCRVIKDAGDDPDITHKAEIGARVRLETDRSAGGVRITGGRGVGRVTKPGLEVPPGEPAINPGPRKMMVQAVEEVRRDHGNDAAVSVEVFVPEGERLARSTLNARLGILGGISILGTTGIVKPMSHEAYEATIRSALSVARAAALDRVVLTTGRRSERFAQAFLKDLPEEAFVQIGDYFRASLETAVALGFSRITLAVFFGKAVKMAQGVPHTHAARSSLSLARLSEWTREATADPALAEEILGANTARQAFDRLSVGHRQVVDAVGRRMVAAAINFAGNRTQIRGIVFDYEGGVAFDNG
jgi:cobalt-precorrin-5B (C1)-methyltransferase